MSDDSVQPSDEWIHRCLLTLSEEEGIGTISGVLLFGSRAKQTADPGSDYDLIVLGERPRKLSIESDGRTLDLTCGTRESLTLMLHKESTWNNNFILNALSQGVVLVEDETLSALIEQAKQIRASGPTPMTKEYAARSLKALEQMHRSAADRIARNDESGSVAALTAKMRADQTASRSTYLYFMAQREWTDSLPEMLRLCREKFPAYYSLWESYAAASADGSAAPLEAMVLFTCSVMQNIASQR